MKYIQRKGNGYLETVDSFTTYRDAVAMLREYRISDPSAHYYISQRSCKGLLIMTLTANTIDGTVVYQSNTHQGIADMVCNHIDNGLKPHIAYTFDQGTTWPYTTWHKGTYCYVGTQHRTFDETVNFIRKNNNEH